MNTEEISELLGAAINGSRQRGDAYFHLQVLWENSHKVAPKKKGTLGSVWKDESNATVSLL